ncbi:unnamed protein product (macronuclear) [Paramecium tetraurelia]|uniref:Uncharacterized protein n=1 Tax=Paramecium tetraurelia TaxID=5888 RepID=A0DD47_PARTE|nr:uncharacterized protein GSPATT00015823001 [Paramecium tetraurelia]CAK80964.1 unnamed protein product [Paramecium tetraurelia]|eukprot:XP_001448361.1 hypothetical protein (macronuclear) [Paramecium tetraurelia strain d4-2]
MMMILLKKNQVFLVSKFIDRLRQQKEMQQKLKQQQAAILDHNKKVSQKSNQAEQLRSQIVKDILPKHKGLQLAYDYDGTFMLAKDLTQVRSHQRAPEIHKITSVDTVFQPQKPIQQAVIENEKVKKEQQRLSKSKTNPPQIFEASYQKPFEGFTPNHGVKLIYQDQNQEIVKQQDIQNWGDGQRMTKKQFEALKNEGFKPSTYSMKQQMLQKINSDIMELQEPKNTPIIGQSFNQINELKISQSYTNLKQLPQQQQTIHQLPQTAQNRKQNSKINVVDKYLLDQLLS